MAFEELPIPTTLFDPAQFAGADGREIELQITTTHIQWRYLPSGPWQNLVGLEDLQGPPGEQAELRATATHIQGRTGDGEWQDLVALEDLKGVDAQLPEDIITGSGFTRIEVVAEGAVPDPPTEGVLYWEFPPEALE